MSSSESAAANSQSAVAASSESIAANSESAVAASSESIAAYSDSSAAYSDSAAASSESGAASEKKMIVLKSSDGETFEIEEVVANESLTLKHMIEDDCADNEIPLPNVTSRILAKVIEYCRRHVEASAKASGGGTEVCENDVVDEDLKKFDAEFVKEELDTLIDLILAANYLNIKKLMDFTCATVANTIRDWSVEEVRVLFNIKNDYTPEEEAEVRRENSWAFE